MKNKKASGNSGNSERILCQKEERNTLNNLFKGTKRGKYSLLRKTDLLCSVCKWEGKENDLPTTRESVYY